ncbi:tyrosine-type recombinase/integrase [Cohnella lubricantis]|uniref:Tyrosine-type recombinase/integrase n=1 Tax=Cohnella lubricantis TaxID=2163172 RepID=A0A841T8W7_9BACL|nr:tyrosine-type recombinase/integrase [Cohnella lubricantis]MBB6676496.1 tyrosine-type recombinase/integrase [Cohnella lubricantis]MBP2117116.1 integrase [Cohnella lubricantis]
MKFVQPIRDKALIVQIKNYLKVRSFRDYLMFSMGIHSGLRISDLLNLQVWQVRGQLHVTFVAEKTKNRRRKRRKEKKFIIHPDYREDLEVYIRDMPDDAYLFASRQRKRDGKSGLPICRETAWKMLSKAAKHFDLQEIGCHSLRKTWGYHMIMGSPPEEMNYVMALLMEAFGHETQEETLRYLGLTQDTLDRMILRLSFTQSG